MRSVYFAKALEDPAGAFHSPEEIVSHHALTLEEKRRLLEAWRKDEQALSASTGDDASLVRRMTRALADLDGDDGRTPPAATD